MPTIDPHHHPGHEPVRLDLAAHQAPDRVGYEPAGLDLVARDRAGEDGSLITEYGLLAIVAATVAAAVISWASDGAMATLFNALLRQARGIVGA